MPEQVHDVLIVGVGPAGLAAGMYTARDRYKTLMLDKFMPGGQILTTDRIENYPGFERISGPELIQRMQDQVRTFGAEVKSGCEATSLRKEDDGTLVVTVNDGEAEYRARAVILAPGSDYRHLGVPGEHEFRQAGAGVSYCGTCDGPFFKDKIVVAVGGGNAAVEETLGLGKFARKTYLVHRRQEFRAQAILVEELMANKDQLNIEPVLDAVVEEILGDQKVERVRIRNVKTNRTSHIACDGVFIFIGHEPNTKWLEGSGVKLDERGFVLCDAAFLRTTLPGVFVAGDCRIAAAMQLATACGDGVTVAMMLKNWFADPQWWHRPAAQTERPRGW